MHHKKEHSHIIMMILACLIPFAIILTILFLGISSKLANIIIIIFMVVLHIIIIKNHFSDHNKIKEANKNDR